mgnify:CR=1 FL=1
MKKYLLIIATLDTKGREAAYVKDCVQTLGIHPVLMDVKTPEATRTDPPAACSAPAATPARQPAAGRARAAPADAGPG